MKAVFETGVRVPTITVSGHRCSPKGANDPEKEVRAMDMMKKCSVYALDIGVSNVQLAGKDVYYEEKYIVTRACSIKNSREACTRAEEAQIILSREIMCDPFMNSLEKF